jgi:DNA polymerase-3 subunit epsilon
VHRQLDDGVIVAHNSRFDIAFLAAELGRAGLSLPAGPVLCTMGLASHLGVPVAGRSLGACCAFYDIALDFGRAHGAETDAQATACLLLCMLREARAQGIESFAGLGCTAPPPTVRETGEARPRTAAQPRKGPARLVTAVRRLADTTPPSSADVSAYLDLLDRVLMDRVLTSAEADALQAMARRCELNEHDTGAAHRSYLRQLVEYAWEDGVLTHTEAGDLGAVGALLGMSSAEIDELVNVRKAACRS